MKLPLITLWVLQLSILAFYYETVSRKFLDGKEFTVWKFQDFAITQIFREINFWDSKNAKLAILTHLEALNFDFQEFLHFLKAVIYQIDKIQSPENGKNCSFSTSNFSKIDFT